VVDKGKPKVTVAFHLL